MQIRPRQVRFDSREIERSAHDVVDLHAHFYHRADQFQFSCRGDILTVRGTVPSFYLKQVLQRALQDVHGICQVDNQVAVVSAFGLSSIEASEG